MPYPGESGLESLGSNNSIEEVQAMLNARYPDAYAVYNLSARTYRSDRWFDGRVSHRVFEPNRAPALRSLMELCLNARLWLSQKPENICVIHCTDGRALSAILVCSLLCFCRLFDNVSPALQLFSSKRGNPHLSPSQIRYIDYVAQLAHGRISPPHQRPLKLIKLTVAPVPTFNKSKSYVLEDGKIELLLNGTAVMGDLTVVIYHCRSSFAGRNKIASVKIAQFQLYTGFLEPQQSELIYFKSDLDCLDTSSGFGGFTSRYAESFNITLEFMVSPKERPRQGNNLVYPWEMMPGPDALRPDLCVSSEQELHALLADFGRFNIDRTTSKRTPPARPKPANRPASSSASNTNSSGAPSTDVSHNLVGDLSNGSQRESNTEELIESQDKHPGVDSPQSNSVPKLEETTSDVWSPEGAQLPEHNPAEDSTPVADLLGFNSANPDPLISRGSPTPPPPLEQTNVLIDVDLAPTPSDPLPQTTPDVSALVDDFFNVTTNPDIAPSDKPSGMDGVSVDNNWAAAFDLPTTHVPSSSNNPFDIFGDTTTTTTGPIPVVDDFMAPPPPSVPPISKVSPSNGDPPHFDAWWAETGPGHMSSSASATNLTAGSTTTAATVDPFANLSNVFGRPHDSSRSRSTAAGPASTAATSGGFSAGPSPVHRPTSTGQLFCLHCIHTYL
ncbi:unnamed protein product [Echinostoma caproni]|uniref:C2 tensin-type domain-containing protein n=1 Tax=Echinostoma caproni TaxID=27848 RepID=A0A183AUJ1_9TREM|nr:unnamed protein product [Echinostoma caproni]